MDLLLQLQNDIEAKLLSEPLLQYNSVAQLRKFVIAQEAQKRLPHLTLRPNGPTGKYGCGILVNMPSLRGKDPNITVPVGDWTQTIDVIENPELNFGPQGTQVTCEQTARTIRSLLHQFNIVGLSILYQDDLVIEPIADANKLWPNCLAYRVSFQLPTIADAAIPKCVMPNITSDAAGNVTITPGAAGDTIYYTVDGSFPCANNLTTATPPGTAVLYTGPFQAASGTIVRATGYATGFAGSDVNSATVTCAAPVLTAGPGHGGPLTALAWSYGGIGMAYWQIYSGATANGPWSPFAELSPATLAYSTDVQGHWWMVQGNDANNSPITPPSNAAQH